MYATKSPFLVPFQKEKVILLPRKSYCQASQRGSLFIKNQNKTITHTHTNHIPKLFLLGTYLYNLCLLFKLRISVWYSGYHHGDPAEVYQSLADIIWNWNF